MPKTKNYVLLHNADATGAYMMVPVKAALNPYNNKEAYCAAMPQFFGGTGTNLQKEVTEESRKTILYTDTQPQCILKAAVNDVTYTFYESGQWKKTGTPWNGNPANKSEKEMEAVIRVERTPFLGLDEKDIIAQLLELTQIPGLERTEKAMVEFDTSETRKAFLEFINAWITEQ